MPRYSDSAPIHRTHASLVDAVRSDADLPDEEWERLHKLATPYQRRVARMIIDPSCAPHGVETTYTNWGCRCDPCSDAATEARRSRGSRGEFGPADVTLGADATPLEKALQARRMGFTLTPQAEELIALHESEDDISSVI